MSTSEAIIISQCETIPRLRVTVAEIQEVKRQHIKENLLYSPEEAMLILGISRRALFDLVREGKLEAADGKAKKVGASFAGSSGLRVTAPSIEHYRKSIIIPPEKWNE